MALPQTSISPSKCRQSVTDFISSYLRGPKAGQRPETFNVVKLSHEELRPFSTLCIWKISKWSITIKLLGRLKFFCIQVQRSHLWFYPGKDWQQQNTSNPCGMWWNESVLYVWKKMGLRLRLVNDFQELVHVYVKIRELSSPSHTVSLSRKVIQWDPL